MNTYNPIEVEEKWQMIWAEKELYKTDLYDESREKFYNLVMFPYPSGDKLHIGHWYNFAPSDSFGRFMRMKGFNVFEPQGYDSFGLPAENYAIKHGVHPTKSIAQNIEYMRMQLRKMGTMYDYSHEIVTSNPEYYKWTQWIFLKLYENGLAYKKEAPVNWCPSCQTVLANEQVVDGRCERCKHEVTKKNLSQWFFKIRDYAEKLLDYSGLDWPEKTILMQKHWIGRSEGSEVDFKIVDKDGNAILVDGKEVFVSVFTTRADTLFGVSYVVLAPEHNLTTKIASHEHLRNVEEYIERAKKTSDIERSAEGREKTGVFTGAYALNPINDEVVPVWTSDYVLMHYGTGAVMAVPAHDERDFEFAKKYDLPVRVVIKPADFSGDNLDEIVKDSAFTEYGVLCNSSAFNDMSSSDAKIEISRALMKRNSGKLVVNYKLRDWLISRQRYWGAPIPVVYCDKCGTVPVPESDLPVLLPEDVDFTPKGDGKSPLNTSSDFVNTSCPKCGGKAKREVDTMDTFVDSSWYFLRYMSSDLSDKPFDKELTKKWMPVDMYIGGPEHACMHLIYARFINMALFDLGYAPFKEPFHRLVHQGMITKDGAKMSKSKGNTVSPDEFVSEYGSDVFRMFLMFMGPYTEGGDFSDKGITGIARFVNRFFNFIVGDSSEVSDSKSLSALHKSIKKVSSDLENLSFNTAIASLMELLNVVSKNGLSKTDKMIMVQLIAPFAPHFAEEMWESLGGEFSVFDSKWPDFDEGLIVSDSVHIAVQVNGKLRGDIDVDVAMGKDEIIALAKEHSNVKKFLVGEIVKEVYVPGRLVNFVVR